MKSSPTLTAHTNYIRPHSQFAVALPEGVCEACGGYGPFSFAPIITDTLAAQWGLSKAEQRAFSSRESMFCVFCGCSYRLRALAHAINLWLDPTQPQRSLREAIAQGATKQLDIAEINSCGVLHDILRAIPDLAYSEYGSTNPEVPDEDLQQLSYADERYDMVLTSDTLEHVPNPSKALREIWRVLKPGGAHIFTVPLRMDKRTKQRAYIDDKGKLQHTAEASFHGSGEPDYLVQNEFGADFITELEAIGFAVTVYFQNTIRLQDPSGVIVAVKPLSYASASSVPAAQYIERAYSDKPGLETALHAAAQKAEVIDPPAITKEVQLERVAALAQKIALTQQHATNLEAIRDDQQQHIARLTDHLTYATTQLQAIYRSRSWRVLQKLRSFRRTIG
jgi:SAM-dependent methyltransferase